jgi:hypothetical protein
MRVFKPSARSKGFADRLIARWRFVGPVWMIAGPDLAGALMEPDEFFVWLGGRLRERFIAEPAQVAERVAALDGARDPDGRFRVSELFCADTTWRDAVLALIARADVVLLDLREFTPARAGTRYELVQLLRRAPLAKVRVLVDAKADLEPLRAAIAAAWAEAARPASADQASTLNPLRIGAGSERELVGLARAAAQAASTRASSLDHQADARDAPAIHRAHRERGTAPVDAVADHRCTPQAARAPGPERLVVLG